MPNNFLNKKEIELLLPHREPMLLVDKLINIEPLKSATGILNVKKTFLCCATSTNMYILKVFVL